MRLQDSSKSFSAHLRAAKQAASPEELTDACRSFEACYDVRLLTIGRAVEVAASELASEHSPKQFTRL